MITTECKYVYNTETIAAARKLIGPVRTVDLDAHERGMQHAEPLIVMLDSLLRYAQAYRRRFEGFLASDQVLGGYWLDALKGVKRLLDGDGAFAMERGYTTDSKSNGACETMFWNALNEAGFKEGDL